MTPQTHYVFSIVIVGDRSIGKTSLLRIYSGRNDIGTCVGFAEKVVEQNGRRILLKIGDTGGLERFRSVTSSFYRNAKGVILCYSQTSAESFSRLESNWLSDINQFLTKDTPKVLVEIKKLDHKTSGELDSFRTKPTVPMEEISSLCNKYKMHYMPVRLSKVDDIEAVFNKISDLMIEQYAIEDTGNSASVKLKPELRAKHVCKC